nr:group II intron maturase-specific domain-containing protein [Mesorhizobium sp. L103C119B0]
MTGAGRVSVNLDWYIGLRLYCWLRKKRPKAGVRELWGSKQPSSRCPTRRLWRDGPVEQHLLGWTPVGRHRLAALMHGDEVLAA